MKLFIFRDKGLFYGKDRKKDVILKDNLKMNDETITSRLWESPEDIRPPLPGEPAGQVMDSYWDRDLETGAYKAVCLRTGDFLTYTDTVPAGTAVSWVNPRIEIRHKSVANDVTGAKSVVVTCSINGKEYAPDSLEARSCRGHHIAPLGSFGSDEVLILEKPGGERCALKRGAGGLKRGELTEEQATRLMEIWRQHIGFFPAQLITEGDIPQEQKPEVRLTPEQERRRREADLIAREQERADFRRKLAEKEHASGQQAEVSDCMPQSQPTTPAQEPVRRGLARLFGARPKRVREGVLPRKAPTL
jgi:hypothetical protein